MISRELSHLIQLKMDEISKVFGGFQQKTNLVCPPGCGKCCTNPEISCSPYELLPLAFHLLDQGMAESIYEKAQSAINQRCLFLEEIDESQAKAQCMYYSFRPFVCRAFGVGARLGKNGTELSACRVLKSSDHFLKLDLNELELPYIEIWRKQLGAINPQLLEKEMPLNSALIQILEKVLLWDSLQNSREH